MATSSKRNDEFFEACSGSEIKVSRFSFGEVLASPNAETLFISSPSIQLSLGGLLSSRAHLCFAGQQQLKAAAGKRSILALGAGLLKAIRRRPFHSGNSSEPKEELDPNRRTP
jgi:hypothetical protein